MMTALYTVNLRIAGRANVPIYNMTTLFDNALVKKIFTGSLAPFANTIIILVITLIMKFLLDWYMSTKSGYLLRAVGDNETIVTSMGVDKGVIKIIGLAIECAPKFFRAVYPLLPFTHSMAALRESVGGCYGNDYWMDLAKLGIFLVIALFMGLVLRKPIIRMNEAFTEQLEETKII